MVASNTTSHLLFTSHHFGTRCDLAKYFSSNLVCAKIILHEYFFDENILDEIKANYGILAMYVHTYIRVSHA